MYILAILANISTFSPVVVPNFPHPQTIEATMIRYTPEKGYLKTIGPLKTPFFR